MNKIPEHRASLGDLLAQILPYLDSTLIDDTERLLHIGQQLPCAPIGLLEVRLGKGKKQTDLSQCFKLRDRSDLATWLQSHSGPHWEALQLFSKNLTLDGHPFSSGITDIGLEVDIPLQDNAQGPLPVPNLFVKPHQAFAANAEKQKLLHLISTIARCFFDEVSVNAVISNARKALLCLPKNTTVNYIGVMLARPNTALRLQFHGIALDQIAPYLEKIGVSKIPLTLAKAVSLARPYFKSAVLCLDLLPRPASRVGLELFNSQIIPGYSPADFLDRLTAAGLCTKIEKQALDRWPGQMDPGPLLALWKNSGSSEFAHTFLTIQRQLTHLKLLVDTDNVLQAKAYLEFRRRSVALTG